MKDQVNIYAIQQEDLYTTEEQTICRILSDIQLNINAIKQYELLNLLSQTKQFKYTFTSSEDLMNQQYASRFVKRFVTEQETASVKVIASPEYTDLLNKNSAYKALLVEQKIAEKALTYCLDSADSNIPRELKPEALTKTSKKHRIFASSFTRTLGLVANETTTDIFSFQITNYVVAQHLMKSGFDFNGEHYSFYTATAGGMRDKKLTYINDRIYKKHSASLLCGITHEDIDFKGGIVLPKLLAYSALLFSASDPWPEFDIDRAIVIPDWSTTVTGLMDVISEDPTTLGNFIVTPSVMVQNTIVHSDGAGWINPSLSKKNLQVRLPFFKGLLVSTPYLDKCAESGNYMIPDIYGDIHDLRDVDVVFSASMFKMSKYYSSWNDYKTKYKTNHCTANICNEEEEHMRTGSTNYQFLQSMISMTEKELEQLITPVRNQLTDAYSQRDTMLALHGATPQNKHKSLSQEALMLYPEMLQDYSTKQLLKDRIHSMRYQASMGKIRIKGSVNTYVIPDMGGWLNHEIAHTDECLLQGDEVSCSVFQDQENLLLNRSPALYLEHVCAKNVVNSDTKHWNPTKAIMTSSFSLCSKVLMFDVDGDHLLVSNQEFLYNAAKRSMDGVLPLSYSAGKSKLEQITNDNIWTSLKLTFKHGSIGTWSNKLSKFYNSDEAKHGNLQVPQLLTFLNNLSIDVAKTGYFPTLDKRVKDLLKGVNGADLPYYLKYDDPKKKVEPINDSLMNRLCKKIEDIPTPYRYDFSQVGKFDYKTLLHDKDAIATPEVVELYDKLDKAKTQAFMVSDQPNSLIAGQIYSQLRKDMVNAFPELSLEEIVDQIVVHSFTKHKTAKRTALMTAFGDVILDAIKHNIENPLDKGYFLCQCGARFKQIKNNQKYCKPCSVEANKAKAKALRASKKAI
ncbi:RNA dependent RNA polymerase [Desulfosporosinus metallidurans]|uniref:Phage protein n=1 Tax=Desulfosporosinus metallidurans TaxID=1888891 RepID=A0A1Q8QEP6_9FIRM|nr:hypothetical protein [Desulfosporosinus metallidurans]OLN25788.1 Phage protein [Desulfosporosinus metallidurans]